MRVSTPQGLEKIFHPVGAIPMEPYITLNHIISNIIMIDLIIIYILTYKIIIQNWVKMKG